ncbi:hypothetical protein HPB51_028243 [Rhipicephalus microplus]|uniref:Uncharacterized protein n=1 Tax=Rhipicephalus microplus TaxID=6941 RepID=A0A9J6CXV2_RHIMP|nr:hypothetical protein HPB51_028243 [Rhipicephalus microplus]
MSPADSSSHLIFLFDPFFRVGLDLVGIRGAPRDHFAGIPPHEPHPFAFSAMVTVLAIDGATCWARHGVRDRMRETSEAPTAGVEAKMNTPMRPNRTTRPNRQSSYAVNAAELYTPSVVGEDSLCLDDPKVDADMSQEEGAKPGAQSEAPTAESSVRNVRGGRLSLLQHTLDVELEARLDAMKADKKHKEIEHNQRMECMREEHEIKISTLKEQRKNCNIQHKIKFRILK